MFIKFSCVKCGHRLKAYPEQAGKACKCSRCRQTLTVPDPPEPARRPKRSRLLRVTCLAVALAAGIFLALLLYQRTHLIDQKVSALTAAAPETRARALLWLAEADPQDAYRPQVTAALEPLLVGGDARGSLDADLVLRAYLRWAAPDNVPALIRLVENPDLRSWDARKTGSVLQTLGKLQDDRAADVLARRLPDRRLRDQAVYALRLLGPGAEPAVLGYLFDGDPATRQRAGELLAEYRTAPATVLAEARRRLRSDDPAGQRAAAAWFADNPPAGDADRAAVAGSLVGLLGDLSTATNGLALRALKLWATPDSLPPVVDYARRLARAGATPEVAANKTALIDVLARFPDAAAANAIALQLTDPALRGQASQALAKLGPVAGGAVLRYLNHPDAGARQEAARLALVLNLPADRQLEQTLADVADARQSRGRTALQHLARLRPDAALRAKVSQALNAPLLDTDPGIRDDALGAVRVWATPDNTATLLRLLGNLHGTNGDGDARAAQKIAEALITIGPGAEEAVVPLLRSADALVRREACWVLAEIGTAASATPLRDAGMAYLSVDPDYYLQTQAAVARVTARN
jgi:hypothetical protein